MDGFSTRVMRGDRIGLIGPNGAGKTTLLRLLIGELALDGGQVRHGADVQIAYYDQQREQLDPERTVVDTIGDGNDHVTVAGRTRHVMGYLQDFLFARQRARSPVKALSGGATACFWPGSLPVQRACWSSTSRPTISISRPSSCSKRNSWSGRARCCSSVTTGAFWITS